MASTSESSSEESDSDIEMQNLNKSHKSVQSNFDDIINLAINGDIKLLDKLPEDINAIDKNKYSILHYVILYQQYELGIKLIELGVKVDTKGPDGMTPFHFVCNSSFMDEQLQELLDKMIQVDDQVLLIKDKFEMTGLHYAALKGNHHIVSNLINNNSNLVSIKNNKGNTALMLATAEGHKNVVEFLLKLNPDLRIKNKQDENILHVVTSGGHIDVLDSVVQCMKDSEIMEEKNTSGETPLHIASKNCKVQLLKTLFETELINRKIISAQNSLEETPCHVAAKAGNVSAVKLILQKYPFTAHLPGKNGKTPVHVAAANGKLDCLELLLRFTPDKNIKGQVFIDAAKSGHAKIVDRLLVEQKDKVYEALNVAMENQNCSVIETIIDSDHWKMALGQKNSYDQMKSISPMAELMKSYPTMAEKVLDKCFDYDKEKNTLEANTEFIEDNTEKKYNTTWKSMWGNTVRVKNHPMMILANQKHGNLVKHPVILMWTKKQWSSYGRTIFLIETVLYLSYLFSISSYSCSELSKESFYRINSTSNFTMTESFPSNEKDFIGLWWWAFISTSLCLFYEMFQLLTMKMKYFSHISNIVEILLFVATVVLLKSPDIYFPVFEVCQSPQCWKWPTAAILLPIAWLNLLKYLKFFSFFGIFLIMFGQILTIVLKLSLMLCIFLLAFSLSFHTSLVYEKQFSGFGWSFLKTAVMSLGEFDYNSIFKGEFQTTFHTVSILTFVALMVVLTIVLMNMLIGIAVDNISKIQEEAEVEKVCSQIELVLEMRKPGYTKMVKKFTISFLKMFTCCLKKHEKTDKNTIKVNLDSLCLKQKCCILNKRINSRLQDLFYVKHFMSDENILKNYKESKINKKADIKTLQKTVEDLKDEICSLKKEFKIKK